MCIRDRVKLLQYLTDTLKLVIKRDKLFYYDMTQAFPERFAHAALLHDHHTGGAGEHRPSERRDRIDAPDCVLLMEIMCGLLISMILLAMES